MPMIDTIYLDIENPPTNSPMIVIGDYTFYLFKYRKDSIVYKIKEHQLPPNKWCKLVLCSYEKPSEHSERKVERYYVRPSDVEKLKEVDQFRPMYELTDTID